MKVSVMLKTLSHLSQRETIISITQGVIPVHLQLLMRIERERVPACYISILYSTTY